MVAHSHVADSLQTRAACDSGGGGEKRGQGGGGRYTHGNGMQ